MWYPQMFTISECFQREVHHQPRQNLFDRSTLIATLQCDDHYFSGRKWHITQLFGSPSLHPISVCVVIEHALDSKYLWRPRAVLQEAIIRDFRSVITGEAGYVTANTAYYTHTKCTSDCVDTSWCILANLDDGFKCGYAQFR